VVTRQAKRVVPTFGRVREAACAPGAVPSRDPRRCDPALTTRTRLSISMPTHAARRRADVPPFRLSTYSFSRLREARCQPTRRETMDSVRAARTTELRASSAEALAVVPAVVRPPCDQTGSSARRITCRLPNARRCIAHPVPK
jgi:hypothetical protein